MTEETSPIIRTGFCIFIDTFCQGTVPLVSDEGGFCIFETELEAQREIADYAITRLQQFLDGERDFDDALSIEEYILPVTLHANGTLTTPDGTAHPSHPD